VTVTAHDPAAFDLAAPLPPGVTVLQASAGTGKTYAISGLAARFVAEGKPLERILLVTFTRMATSELRERVRERLTAVERCLRRHLATGATAEDPVVRLLVARGAGAVNDAAERLRRALASFDAATIATTHGFCQEALGGLGIAADLEPGVRFVEDLSDLVSEVLDDLYIRRFHREDSPALTRSQALAIARIAVGNPTAPIAPASGEHPEMRRRLAFAVRSEFEERKRRLAVMTYDDLLVRLREALRGPEGPAVAKRIRDRYDVVLVDEFQDTDPVQWEIMRLAFAQEGGTLVLVADPKQSIYAFRGADVYAYLEAAAEAQAAPELTTNRRSDQQLLDAYDALFGNAKLGHEGIEYRHVRSAVPDPPPRVYSAPLRVRILEREQVECTASGFAKAPAARARIAEDLAGDVADLLDSDAQVALRDEEGEPEACVGVAPGHVAVLVRTNAQAADITEALGRAGIPAVINGAGSVFATDGARDWLALLEALERPASITRAHAAALTPFLGWSARRVAEAGEEDWETLHQRLHEFSRVLRLSGVASLQSAITAQERLPARMLSTAGGERHLTDIRHIGQLLETAARAEQLGLTALTGWLRRRMLEAARDSGDEERSRRLESDADAVQVLTIHRSKGLEFPIVYLPYLWDAAGPREGGPVAFHDPDAGNERTLDVALEGHEYRRHYEQHLAEERGEELRLAYVALTRARHQAVIWWATSWWSRDSPLGRLVFARAADGTIPPSGRVRPSDQTALETFSTLGAQATGRVGVEWARLRAPRFWRAPLREASALDVAEFDRSLDRRWRRTSYSDITAAAHDARVASESEEPMLHDEPEGATPAAEPEPVLDLAAGAALATPSLLSEMPVGIAAGTLVHQALEATDFAAADLDAELERALESAPGRRAVPLESLVPTVAGLRAALETPLGPEFGEIALRDLRRGDRLDELSFELPLAGGEQPRGGVAVTLAAVADLLRSTLAEGDPFHAYATHLDDPALRQSVRGYLTGSLDLVLRLDGPRFAVVDYKTNWLADPDEPLTGWHYRPAALVTEMHQRHYGLQALLYLVALHRYLRWRLPGYEPERNLAGVAYLFVRGMSGPATPILDGRRCGVFAWRPPPGLIEALSDVLDLGAGP